MNKYEIFLNYFRELNQDKELPEEVKDVLESIEVQSFSIQQKPPFTENGLKILEYLQGQKDKNYKAKEIADGMEISSRTVSGAMRKLVTDGYVDKIGQNPVIYRLNEKGRQINIDNFKGENVNE